MPPANQVRPSWRLLPPGALTPRAEISTAKAPHFDGGTDAWAGVAAMTGVSATQIAPIDAASRTRLRAELLRDFTLTEAPVFDLDIFSMLHRPFL